MITVLGSEDERGTEPLRLCPRCKTEQMVLKKTKDGRYSVGTCPFARVQILQMLLVVIAYISNSIKN